MGELRGAARANVVQIVRAGTLTLMSVAARSRRIAATKRKHDKGDNDRANDPDDDQRVDLHTIINVEPTGVRRSYCARPCGAPG